MSYSNRLFLLGLWGQLPEVTDGPGLFPPPRGEQ